jgi:Uma2 family endonuclease
MTPTTIYLPLQGRMAGFRRFSVKEYHKLIEIGILTEDDNLELLDGYLVHKMSRNPPHDAALQLIQETLPPLLPAGCCLRMQSAITLSRSEPEPDAAIVRGNARTYATHHPTPADAVLVIEVADSTLDGDRIDKARIYAEAGIDHYWIVNLVNRQIEVYTNPSPASTPPSYAQRQDYRIGADVPLLLGTAVVTSVPAGELLP